MVVTKNPVILEGTIKKEEQAEEEEGGEGDRLARRQKEETGWKWMGQPLESSPILEMSLAQAHNLAPETWCGCHQFTLGCQL